jgi:hypothetical protein
MNDKIDSEDDDERFDKNVILSLVLITVLLLGGVAYLYFPGFKDDKIVSVITVENSLPPEADAHLDEYYEKNKLKQDQTPKTIFSYNGDCQMKLDINKTYQPCNTNVLHTIFQNGRTGVTFIKDGTSYSIFGGRDRQPELENYYISMDSIRIMKDGRYVLDDPNINGECHLKMNKAATKFYLLDCDIFNSINGSSYRFELQNIKGFKRKEFIDEKNLGSPT